jgi:5-formyltetrahydrofolate cyclo-ligase
VQRPLEEVRANVRADIASIDPEDRIVQAEEIERRLLEHPAVRDAERMLCFYSAGENGVPTLPMIQRLVEFQGRRAFLPFFLGGDPAGEIKITEWQPSAPVILTPYIGAQPWFRGCPSTRRAAGSDSATAISTGSSPCCPKPLP